MIRRLILAYILTTSIVAGQDTTYGLVGGTVTLKTNVKDTPDQILWKHKGNKVVEVDGQEQHVFGSFLNRITLNRSSVDLKIADLSYEDSGEYVLETYNKGLTRSNYKLEVIDKVAKPTISCKMNTSSSSSTSAHQATLMCSSEPGQFQSLIKFEWSSHEKSGRHLTISLEDQHDDKVYTCTVSNPVSKESTTFTAKDCYNGDGPGERNAGSDSGNGIAIGIGVAFAIAFAILLMSLLFCKLKHKACFARKGNDEEGASYDETEESDQKGHTPSRAPTSANQPLLPKNNTKSKAECSGKVGQLVQQYESKSGQQKEGSTHVTKKSRTRPHHDVSVEPKQPQTPSRNDKEDSDVTQDRESTENKVSESDPADPEKANVLSGALNNDSKKPPTTSRNDKEDTDVAQASEQPVSDSDKKAGNGEEEKSALANPVSPRSVQPCSPLTTEPLNMLHKDDADEQKEDANSHQVTGETQEKTSENIPGIVRKRESQSQQNHGKQKPPVPSKKPQNPSRNVKVNTDVAQARESTENEVSERDPADPEKANVVLSVSESDKKADEDEETRMASANALPVVQPLPEDGEHKEDADPDQASDKTTTETNAEESDPSGLQEGKESSGLEEETTSPEQKDAEATVNEPNSKQADMESHSEEDNQQDSKHNETVKNLPSENSQQPQSPITPEPDHINTNTCQESSDTEQAASDLEKENSRDSGNGTEETNKEPKVQRSLSVLQKVERFEKVSGQQKEGSTPVTNKSKTRPNHAVSVSESDKKADEDEE